MVIIVVFVLLAIGIAAFFIMGNSGMNFGVGADFSKGSVDFGAMGDSNTFKDVKLNPFEGDTNG